MGVHFKIAHRPFDFQREGSLRGFVQQHEVDFLAYTNANRDYVTDLPFYRGFHVVRDPRDVIVSAYFSHLYSHGTKNWPELEAHRRELQGLSKEDGLLCEMEFSRQEFEEMYAWDYEQEHVLELKMEELTAQPVEGFLQVAQFLDILDARAAARNDVQRFARSLTLKANRLNQKGRRFMPGNLPMFPVPRRRLLSIPRPNLRTILRKENFARLSGGRRRGQENVKSHYRKGTPGDWKNHFNEEHIAYVKRHYNDLLIKLGYETDPDW